MRRKGTSLIDSHAYDFSEGTPELRPPFGNWGGPEISANGRFVAFESPSPDLVRRDDNRSTDVFVYDHATGKVLLASLSSANEQADHHSYEPSISASGRFVAFTSYASNLAPGDTDQRGADVFVRDLRTGVTTIASDGLKRSGSVGPSRPSDSGSPSISADGSRVAFLSDATDLVPGDTNRAVDAFVHDLTTDTTVRVSVTDEGDQLEPFVYVEEATTYRDGVDDVEISGGGGEVVFSSHANGLVEEDKNNNFDIFVHELASGDIERVSVAAGGGEGYGRAQWGCGTEGQCLYHIASHSPSISHAGRYVGFLSGASRLYPNDQDPRYGGEDDVFVHDRATLTTVLVNRFPDGSPARDDNLYGGSISPDGRWISYSSDNRRISPRDHDEGVDIFLQRLPSFRRSKHLSP
jgi:hypothetical protein